jgi:3-methylcrotonyl-CoA carboxylase alpha subunit
VEWQLRAARGEPLPLRQEAITRKGWAIECRLNAEEPEHDYRASLGTLLDYAEPSRLAGVRVDSGLHTGSEVTPYYDSMLAKVIGSGISRAQAVAHVRAGLEQLRIEGLRTNGALLLQILRHPAFHEVLSTRFLEQHFPLGPQAEPDVRQQHVLAVAAAWAASQPVSAPVWGALRGFRLTAPSGHGASVDLRLRDVSAASDSEAVRLLSVDGGYRLCGTPRLRAAVQFASEGCVVHLTEDGRDAAIFHVKHSTQQRWFSWAQGRSMVWDVEHELEHSLHAGSEQSRDEELSATLPGRISEVMAQAGQHVVAGDAVLTLEAMKLYHTLAAPLTGQVRKVHVTVGDIVSHGQLLVEFEPQAVEPAAA